MVKIKKLPKHVNIKEELKSIIFNDDYNIGDKLPGELVLCDKFNVSRITIRRALNELQLEGFITRKRGYGTEILKKKKKYNYELTKLGKLGDLIGGDSIVATIMLKITEKKANKKIAKKLEINEGDVVIEYERVRSIDSKPAVYSIDNIAKERIPEYESFEEMGPSLSQAIGVGLKYTESKVIPVKANLHVCNSLNITSESLCLLLEETTYDANGKPLDFSYEYYPDYLFNINLMRSMK